MKASIFLLLFLFIGIQCNVEPSQKGVSTPFVLEHVHRMPIQPTANPPVMILLHGYGSNEQDLFSLAQHLPPEWLVISARAPQEMGVGRYSWYSIDMTKRPLGQNIAEAAQNKEILKEFIQQVIRKYKVDKNRIVVGGFSQGAIMSYSLALSNPEMLAGIACFSGMILKGLAPTVSDKTKGLEVFISHGQQDPTLPYQGALDAKVAMENMGAVVTFASDNSAHTISNEHFTAFVQWISAR